MQALEEDPQEESIRASRRQSTDLSLSRDLIPHRRRSILKSSNGEDLVSLLPPSEFSSDREEGDGSAAGTQKKTPPIPRSLDLRKMRRHSAPLNISDVKELDKTVIQPKELKLKRQTTTRSGLNLMALEMTTEFRSMVFEVSHFRPFCLASSA